MPEQPLSVPLRDGTYFDIDQTFYNELCQLYYGVDTELYRMRLWCLANPDRRKTRRGAKRFVFNWVNKACQIKPKAVSAVSRVPRDSVSAEPLEVRKENLAKLKRALA